MNLCLPFSPERTKKLFSLSEFFTDVIFVLRCAEAIAPEELTQPLEFAVSAKYFAGESEPVQLTVDVSEEQNPFGLNFMNGCVPM